jgi:hypothetical protein
MHFPSLSLAKNFRRSARLLVLLAIFPLTSRALPVRLVLAIDGISYRDLAALQAGMLHTNFWGHKIYCRAFSSDEGYFPVSRMVSTFPSASDVAWTDIFGDRPLPGYQRTYFSAAANAQISIDGVGTSMEHERQMQWQEDSGFLRALGYLYPFQVFEHELRGLSENFWRAAGTNESFYVYLRSTDDAQHMEQDVFTMLCRLDEKIQEIRARYRAVTGRDLQIVMLSDHGHNHAGRGRRVAVRAFLEHAGYRIATTITSEKDVVLPTAGVESWVEIHNATEATAKLAEQLCQLKGVDVIAARVSGQTNRFLVLNSHGSRAFIDWRFDDNAFRYSPERGDPLNYQSAIQALAQNHRLTADGFTATDDWFAATVTNHYPLAPERIVRGLMRNTLNPATILISLDNRYVNEDWLIQQGSRLVKCGSTHGGLDDLCSDGILLSNFQPTRDTSTARVADQFGGFPGVKNFRAEENGAEWIAKTEQSLTRIKRVPFDRDFAGLPAAGVFLRVWSPLLAQMADYAPVVVEIEKAKVFTSARIRRTDVQRVPAFGQRITFTTPVLPAADDAGERIYSLPPELALQPHTAYKISGWMPVNGRNIPLFGFDFRTDEVGQPVPF